MLYSVTVERVFHFIFELSSLWLFLYFYCHAWYLESHEFGILIAIQPSRLDLQLAILFPLIGHYHFIRLNSPKHHQCYTYCKRHIESKKLFLFTQGLLHLYSYSSYPIKFVINFFAYLYLFLTYKAMMYIGTNICHYWSLAGLSNPK